MGVLSATNPQCLTYEHSSAGIEPVVTKPNKEAAKHFGFLAEFFSADNLASSQWTQEQLGWNPTHPGLLEDLENGAYFNI